MDSRARHDRELTGGLRQHGPIRDQRYLVLLAWMVAGLLLSERVLLRPLEDASAVRPLPGRELAATL